MLDIQIANNIDLKSRSFNFVQGTIVLKKGKCYISKAYPLFYKGTILTKEKCNIDSINNGLSPPFFYNRDNLNKRKM